MNVLTPGLTAVVPVRKMAGKLGLLFKWIQDIEIKKLPLRVVIVEDGIDPATLSQLKEVEHFAFIRIYSGQFDSPGLARNHGLSKVETEWVAFWDSDDLPDPSVIHQEVEVAPPWANVLVGAFNVNNIKTGKNSKLIKHKSLSEIGFRPGIWRFVFRLRRIEKTRFISAKMGEDQVFLSEIDLCTCECKFTDKLFYTYYTGEYFQSTNSKRSIKEIREAVVSLNNFLVRKRNAATSYSLIMYSNLIITGLINREISLLEIVKLSEKLFRASIHLGVRFILIALLSFFSSFLRKVSKR